MKFNHAHGRTLMALAFLVCATRSGAQNLYFANSFNYTNPTVPAQIYSQYVPNGTTASASGSINGETVSSSAILSSGTLNMLNTGYVSATLSPVDTAAEAIMGDTITVTGLTGGLYLGVNLTVSGSASANVPSADQTYVLVMAFKPGTFDQSNFFAAGNMIWGEGFSFGSGDVSNVSLAYYGISLTGHYGDGSFNIPLEIPFSTLGNNFQLFFALESYITGSTSWTNNYTMSVSVSAPAGVTLQSASGVLPGAGGASYSGSTTYGMNNPAVTGPSPCTSGDPVNCATGNLVETQQDLRVSGRGRYLNLIRTFNGLAAPSASSPGAIGYGWTHSYASFLSIDGSGNATVHLGNGATVPFSKSGSTFSAPSFVIATLKQNSDGSYTFTLPNQQADIFSSSGRLITQTDRNGYKTSLAYNGSGNLTSVTDPAGRTLSFSYANGLITSVTDPMGRKVAYGYDASQDLTSVTDPAGNVTRYVYDSSHRLVSMTTPDGGVATNVYDGDNRVSSQTDPAGRTMTFVYGAGTTTITDGDGHVNSQTYTNNRLTALTRGLGSPQAATWTFTYDGAGNRISGTDPNGHTWNATYDAFGNQLTHSDALGRTTTSTYDALNDVLTRTDPLGVTTTYTYTSQGDLAQVSRPLTGTSQTWTQRFEYGDPSHPGDITAIVDANGQTWSRGYDANGDLIRRVDPDGDTWTGSYNSIGWQTSAVMPRGNANGASPAEYTISKAYSLLGQVVESTDQLGHVTRYSYDPNRNMVSMTDANGHVTQYAYNPDNQRIKTTRADGTVQLTSFDNAGNMIGQTDGLGRTSSYGYDALNRLVTITDPLGRVTQYSYDGAGNRIALIDAANEKTSLTYDGANELTAIAYSDGKTPPVSYTYDLDGQRIGMTDGTGTSSYQIDSLHQVSMTVDGAGNRVSYAYDLRGDLTALTYPSGKQVTRGYDAAGRLISVGDWLDNKSSFQYDPDGNLTETRYGNSTTGAFGYDRTNKVTSMDYQFLSFNYVRDNLGQVIDFNSNLAGNETYSYTPINETSQAGLESFAYDPADNMTRLDLLGLSYDVANELTHENLLLTGNLTYDQRGNRIQLSAPGISLSYRYDQANRLIGFGSNATYAYNGDGLRMRKVVNGVSGNFVWQLAGTTAVLTDGTAQFIYGPRGMALEQVNPDGSVLWFHQDQLGSTRALTGRSGNLMARYGYSAYGLRPGIDSGDTLGPALTPLLFAGQYTDVESGLQYLRARYYDPASGQFLTRDPASIGTRQPYLYASGNPINKTDPTGLDDGDDDDDDSGGSGAPQSCDTSGADTDSDSDADGLVAWNPFTALYNWLTGTPSLGEMQTAATNLQSQVLNNPNVVTDANAQQLVNDLNTLTSSGLNQDQFQQGLNNILTNPNYKGIFQTLGDGFMNSVPGYDTQKARGAYMN